MTKEKRPDAKAFGAIGYKDEFAEKDLAGKHIDGLTGLVFATDEAYANHKSPVTGFSPKENEHQGEAFKAVSEAALERGAARKAEEKE